MNGAMVFCGTVVHSTKNEYMTILEDTVIGVHHGKIIFIDEPGNVRTLLQAHNIDEDCVKHLGKHQFLVPGLIDTHAHAPQYPNCGKGLDSGLLEWLEKYTFPTEAKCQDPEYALEMYTRTVNCLLRYGTTTASYFATIHYKSSTVLCDVIEKMGQRAFVGKVNMDTNSPDFYVEDTDESLKETERFIQNVIGRKNNLLKPIVTPRFAITCSMKLMSELGKISRKYDIPIQTHLSESLNECEAVKKLFPEFANYTSVYQEAGLITKKTILAHAVHLSDCEMALLKANGAGISHCPNSNISLRSGLLDAQRVISCGIKIGLGTDISGGYSCSMLDAMRMALGVSNVNSIIRQNYQPIDYKQAFMMATLGGSRVLGLEDVTGNFEVGKDFDALVVDAMTESSLAGVEDCDTMEDIIQKFIYLGDDRNIIEVYVAGRRVV
ncbi:hypothetical protein ScPMuIL_018225 [Solemya velum]